MMKKVLIALDYDPSAKIVAEAGFLMFKSMNAEITLLHVVSEPILYYASYREMAPLLENLEERNGASQVFLDKLKGELGDESIQTLIKVGDTSESILNAAKEINANIIVLGTHSRKWLENIIVGSVAEKVLKHTTLPLFIIPTKKK